MTGPDERSTALVGRTAERARLEQLRTDAREGRSGTLVIRGDPGVGKTALLRCLDDDSREWHVARADGVESEMELAYSGLHQLCSTMLSGLDDLPAPQAEALATVLGLAAGPAPDRFLVGLGVLTLFANAAEHRPLLCLVDDAHWLDQVSADVLGFVSRRLLAERIAIVCTARTGIGDDVLVGAPALVLEGLGRDEARELLLASVTGPLDPAIADQVIAESHGNPLALVELPRGLTSSELAGGFGLFDPAALSSRIEESFLRRMDALPPDTRQVLLVAAAEPLGDPLLLWRALARLGIDPMAAAAAESEGLLTIGAHVQFRHPLVRTTAYRAGSVEERRSVHLALAEETDPETDADRRAWHLALAATGPDEHVAQELERSAGRAQARGGLAAAAAFLQRAVTLTPDPATRTNRALAAAEANLRAGAFDPTASLLSMAESEPLDDVQRVTVEVLRAHLAFASGDGRAAPELLLHAAQALVPFDLGTARETFVLAWGAAGYAGAAGGDVLHRIATAALAVPRPEESGPLDLLLAGLSEIVIGGHAAATPLLRQAAVAVLDDLPLDDVLRWGWMGLVAPFLVWDPDTLGTMANRFLGLMRSAGALSSLPHLMQQLGHVYTCTGDLAAAASVAAEADALAAAIGTRIPPYTALVLAGMRGHESELAPVIRRVDEYFASDGEQDAVAWAGAVAVLNNGLGRYAEAVEAASRVALADQHPVLITMSVLPELVEAAARSGDLALASESLEHLEGMTRPVGNDYALGTEARCRALVSEDAYAEDCYIEGVERLARTPVRPDLARAHLVYGEWLRRQGRRLDSREQLRIAHEMLGSIGMDAFAERARRELAGTGEKVRRRNDPTRWQLTPQEEQIARLARDGMSNPEIGSQLFISPRTVEWHLRKVFSKLAITSRRELKTALPRGVGG
jgi:DNA-binding CsgD family transcriptional regulator